MSSTTVGSFLSQPTSRSRIRGVCREATQNLISSPQSSTIKKIQTLLSQRRQRRKLQEVVVEGPRIVGDLLRNPETASLVKQIVVTEQRYSEFASMMPSERFLPATSEVLDKCTDTMTNQGIVAVVDMPQHVVEQPTTKSLILVLDAVSDPGNLGTLIRSAKAVGVHAIYLLTGTCDPWNPKAVRSAMGTSFSIPILQRDWTTTATELHEIGCQYIYAASLETSTENSIVEYDQVSWRHGPNALVIGSEGNGITTEVLESLTRGTTGEIPMKSLYVPMEKDVESLNAAVCGSVIMFEYQRQIRR